MTIESTSVACMACASTEAARKALADARQELRTREAEWLAACFAAPHAAAVGTAAGWEIRYHRRRVAALARVLHEAINAHLKEVCDEPVRR